MAKYDRENGCIGHFKIDDIAKDEQKDIYEKKDKNIEQVMVYFYDNYETIDNGVDQADQQQDF